MSKREGDKAPPVVTLGKKKGVAFAPQVVRCAGRGFVDATCWMVVVVLGLWPSVQPEHPRCRSRTHCWPRPHCPLTRAAAPALLQKFSEELQTSIRERKASARESKGEAAKADKVRRHMHSDCMRSDPRRMSPSRARLSLSMPQLSRLALCYPTQPSLSQAHLRSTYPESLASPRALSPTQLFAHRSHRHRPRTRARTLRTPRPRMTTTARP